MTFLIGEPCIDVTDRSCVDVCPVDCIYEGSRKLYIHPEECIDCGACEAACPVEAISSLRVLTPDEARYADDNARFFQLPLAGRDEPLGEPGGAAFVGKIGADTELVANYGS